MKIIILRWTLQLQKANEVWWTFVYIPVVNLEKKQATTKQVQFKMGA